MNERCVSAPARSSEAAEQDACSGQQSCGGDALVLLGVPSGIQNHGAPAPIPPSGMADHDAYITLLMSRGIGLWIDPCVMVWVASDGRVALLILALAFLRGGGRIQEIVIITNNYVR